MIEKKKFKRDYINVATKYSEINNSSPNILNVTFMPESFSAGKNLFRFKPNPMFISHEFPINIEVLDSNGNPIYHEVLRKKEKDKSINVAVYVYDSVPIGACSITILCTVYRDLNGILLPRTDVKKYNYKYTHSLNADKSKLNDSEIVYKQEPIVQVSEKKISIVEEKFDAQKQSGSIGFATYSFKDSLPVLTNFSNNFKKEFEGGKIFFPTLSSTRFPSAQTSSFEYSSSIAYVNSPNQLTLKDPVYFRGTDGTYRPVSFAENQEYNIIYNNSSDSRTVTQNVKSYAQLDIKNLEPEVGQISRIKVFTRSANKPNQAYQLVYDGNVNQKNWMVDTSSNLVENPIGIFSKNVDIEIAGNATPSSINAYSYWNPVQINGAPLALISSASYFYTPSGSNSSSYSTFDYTEESISIVPTAIMSGSQEIIIEQTGSAATKFYKDTVYSIVFDYYNTPNKLDTREQKIAVYMSGSAFSNNTEYGRYLGKVPIYTGAESRKKDFKLRIPVDRDGDGIVRFMIRDGAKISNIRVVDDSNYGFTPNRTRIYVPIDQAHRNEYLDFKIQYFNDTSRESQVSSSIEGVYFTGGNQYIYGNDNIITGSTFLSSYTASGIQLFSNISGSKSGSAIQTYGYNGIEYVLSNSPTSYNYGWSLTQGNPYASSSYSQATVQMINQSGSSFEFRSNPDTFNFNAVGSNSTVLIGNSGSVSSSYLKWDGTNLAIYVNGSLLSPTSGSGGFSTTASYAATASYLLNGGANIKADIVDGASFTGSPRTSTVTFPSPYEDNFYSVSISAESARAWTIESKTLSGFTINSNASDVVSGDVYWMTMPKSSSFIATRDIVTSASYAATASSVIGFSSSSFANISSSFVNISSSYSPLSSSFILVSSSFSLVSSSYSPLSSSFVNISSSYSPLSSSFSLVSSSYSPLSSSFTTLSSSYSPLSSSYSPLSSSFSLVSSSYSPLSSSFVNISSSFSLVSSSYSPLSSSFTTLSSSYSPLSSSFTTLSSSFTTLSSSYSPLSSSFSLVSSSYSPLSSSFSLVSSSYSPLSSSFSLVSSSFSLISSSFRTGSFTGSLQGSSSYSATSSYVNTLTQNVNIVPPSTATNTAIYVSGSNTVGGSTYIDFLRVSNSTSPVVNPNKTFRLDNTGTFQIIDSAYLNNIWSLTDAGIVQIPSAAGKTTQLKATGSVISFNNGGGQIFDDGNFHIHSLNPDGTLWMNASGSGKLIINAQTGATGGVLIGTTTQAGYVTINGSVNATYSYAYLSSAVPSPYTGTSSGTNPYSLTANSRIQASEFNATSDERLKNIIGKIKLADAIRFIKGVDSIQFTWKDEIDKGIKTGYSAQQLVKTGFEHLVGGVPKPGLEESVDSDGFISPKDTQLVVNNDQITPYHSLLIKHLLERIEELEKRLLVSNN